MADKLTNWQKRRGTPDPTPKPKAKPKKAKSEKKAE